jgi:hypothetical protein
MAGLNRADPVIMGHILSQHRELHELLVTVRHAFAASSAAVPDRPAILHDGLVELRDHLQGHFRQEEAGGFMEESLARMPRLARAAREVLGQHRGLLTEIDRLIATLPASDAPPSEWTRAAADFELLTTHLLDHERQENAVVQEGYNEDLGLG